MLCASVSQGITEHIRRLRKSRFEFVRRCHLEWSNFVMRRIERKGTQVSFQCNVCGEYSMASAKDIYDREVESCQACKSTLRARSIVYVLAQELFKGSMALPEFPEDKSIVGIGTSDWEGYASQLVKQFSYQNTHYHKEPRLDLTCLPDNLVGTSDFVISSEVLKHVSLCANMSETTAS